MNRVIENYGSNSVAIQKFQAVDCSKFAEIMNRKFFAYLEFAINARYQDKKPQGRGTEVRLLIYVCLGIFSRSEILARTAVVLFRDVPFGTRGCLCSYDQGVCEVSGLSSNTLTAA